MMVATPTQLPLAGIVETVRAVRERRLSAVRLVESRLERIEALDPALNCFTQVMADRALREAAAVDALVAAGGNPGPLAGHSFVIPAFAGMTS
jgi:aspartyl-tRNA(Asn)/glutamyl-tRNA(Gln) amidotransferase subunit A